LTDATSVAQVARDHKVWSWWSGRRPWSEVCAARRRDGREPPQH